MDHELADPLILKSNHVFFTILEQRAFVQEWARLQHFTISHGQNSDHVIEHQNINDENMKDYNEWVKNFILFNTWVSVATKHGIEASIQRNIDITISILIYILVPRGEYLSSDIHVANHNDTKWDGKANYGPLKSNNLLPIGTYFYVLTLSPENQNTKSGWVYLNY